MEKSLLSWMIGLSRGSKRLFVLGADSLVLPLMMLLAFCLRFDAIYVPDARMWTVIGLTTLVTVYVFGRFGLYRAVIRFVGYQVLVSILLGVTISTLAFTTFGFLLQAELPRSIPFIYFFLTIVAVGGGRFFMRAILNQERRAGKERVIIYGAGFGGLQLATALTNGAEYHPVAFVDDDKKKQGTVLQGLRVHKTRHIGQLVEQAGARKVLLAISELTVAERKRIVTQLGKFKVSVQTIPSYTDVISGKSRIEEIRDLEVEDLLGRDSVAPDAQLMPMTIAGKSVMVTGAGGSIGSELCRQIVAQHPKVLVLYELSEYGLYQIERELSGVALGIELYPILGSVQDEVHLARTLDRFGIQTVFHAAAYKHVPLVEHNLFPAVCNNIFGTNNVARAALAAGVENFILISTDKAVRPTNFMGATKRFAELVLQALAAQESCTTRFSMVRFGNVLDSSGSVVPLFKKQIRAGGPVTVTHAEVNRFFMTIPEAVQLVIQAASMSRGGDVFVLDMGEPVRILDLAKTMISLMGKSLRDDENPEGDIAIEYTGLRPGEKLFEELLIGDNCVGTEHPMITRAMEHDLPLSQVDDALIALKHALANNDVEALMAIMQRTVREYSAADSVVDYLASEQVIRRASNVQPLFPGD